MQENSSPRSKSIKRKKVMCLTESVQSYNYSMPQSISSRMTGTLNNKLKKTPKCYRKPILSNKRQVKTPRKKRSLADKAFAHNKSLVKEGVMVVEEPRELIPIPTPREQNEKLEGFEDAYVDLQSGSRANIEEGIIIEKDKPKECKEEKIEPMKVEEDDVMNEDIASANKGKVKFDPIFHFEISDSNKDKEMEEDNKSIYEFSINNIETSKVLNKDNVGTAQLSVEPIESEKIEDFFEDSNNPFIPEINESTVKKEQDKSKHSEGRRSKEIPVNYNTPQFIADKKYENLNSSCQYTEVFEAINDCPNKVSKNPETKVTNTNSCKEALEDKGLAEEMMKKMLMSYISKPQNSISFEKHEESSKNNKKLEIEAEYEYDELEYTIKKYLKSAITGSEDNSTPVVDTKISTPSFGSTQKKCSFKF